MLSSAFYQIFLAAALINMLVTVALRCLAPGKCKFFLYINSAMSARIIQNKVNFFGFFRFCTNYLNSVKWFFFG